MFFFSFYHWQRKTMHITAMEDQQPGHSPGPRIRPAAKSVNEQEIEEFQVLPGKAIALAWPDGTDSHNCNRNRRSFGHQPVRDQVALENWRAQRARHGSQLYARQLVRRILHWYSLSMETVSSCSIFVLDVCIKPPSTV